MRPVSPLGDDLKAHRLASGSPPDTALIFPRADGAAWTDHDYRNWRKRTFQKAAKGAGLEITKPYEVDVLDTERDRAAAEPTSGV